MLCRHTRWCATAAAMVPLPGSCSGHLPMWQHCRKGTARRAVVTTVTQAQQPPTLLSSPIVVVRPGSTL
jgi:hypothetical protein